MNYIKTLQAKSKAHSSMLQAFPAITAALRKRFLAGVTTAILVAPVLLSASALSGTAQACSATPDPSLGTDTMTVTIPQGGPGTYYIWSRILAPDTTNNSYYLQVDGGCAFNVGDANIPAGSWTWTNKDGSTNAAISLQLSPGAHQIVMTGRESGVGVDRLLFLSDASCVPTGTGSNCTPVADTTPPTVSLSSPASGATVSGTTTVSANAADNVGVASVQFRLDGTALGSADTASPYSTSWDTTKVANGTHSLTAIATDTSGNTATSNPVSVTVSNQSADTIPPSVPTGVAATASTSAQVNLSWGASTDNVGVTGYKVYRNGSSNALTTVKAPATTFADTTVSAGTTYTYAVSAIDAAGNESAKSTPLATVTTPTAADTTPPSVPTGLTSPSQTSTSISLSWSPSTDNTGGSGLAGYHLYRGSTLIASPTTTTYTDTGLNAATAYTYSVSAYDKSANASVASSPVTVSTQPNPVQFSCAGVTAYICEDFTAGASDFTTSGGTWSASSGHYNLTNPTSATDPNKLLYNQALNTKSVSGDFTLSFDGSTPSTNAFADFGAIFGYQDTNNYYYMDYNHTDDSGTNGIFKVVGGTQTKLADFPVTINSGTTYSTKLVKSGSTITVYRGGTLLASATDSTFTAGKVGLGSRNDPASFASFVVTASQSSDTTPPSVPTNVSATAASSSQVNLSWNAATDNVAVTGYRIYRNGGSTPIATVTTTSYGDAGLAPSTTYTYTVSAIDAAGNASTKSTPSASATTSQATATTTLSGAVTSASSGKGIAGASVSTGFHATSTGAAQATTNASGAYVLTGITPGYHGFHYSASGYQSRNLGLKLGLGSFIQNISLRSQ